VPYTYLGTPYTTPQEGVHCAWPGGIQLFSGGEYSPSYGVGYITPPRVQRQHVYTHRPQGVNYHRYLHILAFLLWYWRIQRINRDTLAKTIAVRLLQAYSSASLLSPSVPNYVSWPNLVKIGRCKVAERAHGLSNKKTRAPRDSSQPPFWPKWVDRAQNFLNVVTPWPVHVYRIWSGSAAFCRTYSGKIDFSAQRNQYTHLVVNKL